ncbi:hypothetical protein NEOLI_005134 [Neolecta irregularis DAH-3]|uniref:Secreted protein n=1 Tax=Neolecta irregularis (strain DAH-3) TaxID=1198029 RepID=A0A1U7LP84_NEOID|nr:hypothetical protein NEOLI_005134 [Neolecta irregularis DAH-3]|eukprot:OLL24476.1 hypothetical protein NEOLI_005134 [Neolecta irregularis DAH-3]
MQPVAFLFAAPLIMGALLRRHMDENFYDNENGQFASGARYCDGKALFVEDDSITGSRYIMTCPVACFEGHCVDEDPALKIWATTGDTERMYPRCDGKVLLTGLLFRQDSGNAWDFGVERTSCKNGCQTISGGAHCIEKKGGIPGLFSKIKTKFGKQLQK